MDDSPTDACPPETAAAIDDSLSTGISDRRRGGPRLGGRWKWPLLTLLILGGVLIWRGSDRQPADATQPLVQHGGERITAEARGSLRLLSWNIHHGEGQDGVLDLERIAEVLHESDLAGLYEVHGGWNSNQAWQLADRLSRGGLFAATEHRWWHDHFGNGVVHRVQLGRTIRIPLPGTQGRKFRNAMLSIVPLDETPVSVLMVHLDRVADRHRQLECILSLFDRLQPPCVMMGDLNTTRSDELFSRFIDRSDVSDVVEAAGGSSPPDRIDWMLVRGLETVSAELVQSTASDHPAVQATVRLPSSD